MVMTHPEVADSGASLQMWRVILKILNKVSDSRIEVILGLESWSKG
jgi:hypothetical protein